MSTWGSILPMNTKHIFGQGSRAGIELLPKKVRVGICRSLNSYIPLLGGSGYFKKNHTTGGLEPFLKLRQAIIPGGVIISKVMSWVVSSYQVRGTSKYKRDNAVIIRHPLSLVAVSCMCTLEPKSYIASPDQGLAHGRFTEIPRMGPIPSSH